MSLRTDTAAGRGRHGGPLWGNRDEDEWRADGVCDTLMRRRGMLDSLAVANQP
jgi:hypothetical protein